MELNLELKRRVGGPHKHDALRASHIVECPDGQVRYVSSVFEYFEKRYTIITSFLEQPYTYPDDADFHIMLVVKHEQTGEAQVASEREHLEVQPGYISLEDAPFRRYELW